MDERAEQAYAEEGGADADHDMQREMKMERPILPEAAQQLVQQEEASMGRGAQVLGHASLGEGDEQVHIVLVRMRNDTGLEGAGHRYHVQTRCVMAAATKLRAATSTIVEAHFEDG